MCSPKSGGGGGGVGGSQPNHRGLHDRHVREDLHANPYNARAADAKLAAYEYVGYFVGNNKRIGSALAHVEKGYGFPHCGYAHE
ncbi:uncharacterized protein PAC_09397 [Phialocephala subalpina]|uniref:Uncharacterized protein n=1 Tax=Phialocephala subalpina TaxID=576137 RepID=A0A1L7X3A6_9HELO|nr:uncharacterized protein PAC_09397 [Phialocephala subalpina]